jgi:hypothetical protein
MSKVGDRGGAPGGGQTPSVPATPPCLLTSNCGISQGLYQTGWQSLTQGKHANRNKAFTSPACSEALATRDGVLTEQYCRCWMGLQCVRMGKYMLYGAGSWGWGNTPLKHVLWLYDIIVTHRLVKL